MDRPTNEMVITSVLTFEQPLSFERVEALVRDRLLPIRRFRERIVWSRLGLPSWRLDARFDLATHLHRAALPAPGGDAELAIEVEDIAAQPLDRDRPLWRLHAVEGYRGGTALVMRLHHCIGDGVALIAMLLGITDEGRALRPPEVGQLEPQPTTLAARARRLATQGVTLARLLLLPPDHRSALRGPLGQRKRFALAPPIDLAEIKQIAAAHGTTVNDVVVAAIAGALGDYLAGGPGTHRGLRAMLPLYLRGRGAPGELGNNFGLVYLDLPLDVADPVERLAITHRRMAAIKQSPEATVALEVLGAIGIVPRPVEDLAIALFTLKASVMITNIAGPPGPLHLEGARVAGMSVWAPVSGLLGLGISILSYAGTVRIGVAADGGLIPEPAKIAGAIARQLKVLASAMRSSKVAMA